MQVVARTLVNYTFLSMKVFLTLAPTSKALIGVTLNSGCEDKLSIFRE